MNNGYFHFVNDRIGYGLKLIPPVDGGEEIRLGEVFDYLIVRNIYCDPEKLKDAVAGGHETVLHLGDGPSPVENEAYHLQISDDSMEAVVRFFSPSENGKRMEQEEFTKDLQFRKIIFGIQTQLIQEHFQKGLFCTDLVVAKGKEPRQGSDAHIEYYFNTDVQARPTIREDDSVDFFHLNAVNNCKKGEVLARIIPEDVGECGTNILGATIKQRDVKKDILKYGPRIELSEDKMTISSEVDGHVTLVDGKVFVSDIYEVENVNNSTGDIEYEGSVQVKGNVQSNFKVKAKGNVIVNGVVEGAYIESGGDIIIARGMNGMGKGILKAEGNIVAKFLENVTVSAGGHITAGSVLYSNVMAGTEIEVTGKRGFITGGRVSATNKITVKTLGAEMGAPTIIEVGANPQVKQRYHALQKDIGNVVKEIKNAQPVLENYAAKRAKGVRFTEEQKKYIADTAEKMKQNKIQLEDMSMELRELQEKIDTQSKALVIVTGVVYPGTKVVIGDVSMVVQSSYKYCRFEKVQGDVKMAPI